MIRTQIMLTKKQHRFVKFHANFLDVSIAAYIRTLIDKEKGEHKKIEKLVEQAQKLKQEELENSKSKIIDI